jgi:peptidoglycan/xylan/chitin deacetylase (PgdA/CDA1 family)
MRLIAYHGVVGRADRDDYFAYLFTDVNRFVNQVAWLARHASPVSLAEVADHINLGRPLPPRSVHVSIDDGFRNNLIAAEILDHYRVPWSLFVVVDAVLDGYRPWFVRLADALSATSNVRLPNGAVVEMSRGQDKLRFARLVKAEVMAAPADRQEAVLDRIMALPGMVVPDGTRWPFLSITELQQLTAAGVEIGNHSARHCNLTRCRPDRLREEVHSSRHRLSAALGRHVRFFAYPDGRHNASVRRAVGEDHELGLATWSFRRPEAPLALRRWEPGPGVTSLRDTVEHTSPSRYGAAWLRLNAPRQAREAAYRLAPRLAPLSQRGAAVRDA